MEIGEFKLYILSRSIFKFGLWMVVVTGFVLYIWNEVLHLYGDTNALTGGEHTVSFDLTNGDIFKSLL